jgi:hypothetical protein
VLTRLLSSACVLLAIISYAEARPATFAMTCAQATATVSAQGAIVMSTGQHTFDRFVSHAGYCALGEYADLAWAPTLDSPRCTVGYVCRYRPAPWEFD